LDERVHDRLVELVVTPRLTLPVKPSREYTVTVELPMTPSETVTLVGLAVTI
jgi:hypothetical protein